ncbi:hypothetical protein FGB62_47g136 [Gracilaria domingensis]|nr:hypothetical protein FGB62_47g136 [Gracilaria domingensis]
MQKISRHERHANPRRPRHEESCLDPVAQIRTKSMASDAASGLAPAALRDTEVEKLVAELGQEATAEQIISALSQLNARVSRISSVTNVYTRVSQVLLDKVCPSLLHASPPCGGDVWVMFEGFFLDGNHAIAFRELCGALALNSDVGEIVARILVLFVSKKTGGVARLTEILSRAADPGLVSSLLHLPSRVINILMSTSLTEYDGKDLINEKEYFDAVSEAIYNQTLTSDIARESMLKDLIARLVTMKHSETLINRGLNIGNRDKLIQLISFAPHRSIAPLTRALLVQKTETKQREKELHAAIRILLNRNPVARNSCIHVLPFQQPVFRRPKKTLIRLVRAVVQGCGTEAAEDALMTASEVWSGEAFSSSEDISMQRQVTRIVLYYLKYVAKMHKGTNPVSNSVMMVLVDGVHVRLSANDVRIRRHGMLIGEASSRFCRDKKVLKFEREGAASVRQMEKETIGDEFMEDGSDSDFSELAGQVGKETQISEDEHEDSSNGLKEQDELEENISKPMGLTGTNTQDANNHLRSNDNFHMKGKAEGRKRLIWPQSDQHEEWQQEDDWSSIESYSMTSSSDDGEGTLYSRRALEEDYIELRKKLSAPMSVPRLVGLLVDVNKSDGGSIVVDASVAAAALRTLASRAQANFTASGTLRSASVELCLQIARMDPDRYPDVDVPELAAARAEAFYRVLQMDIGSCGSALVERVICGEMSDMQHRMEALGVLAKAVRSAHERVFGKVGNTDEEASPEVKEVTYVGQSTRVLHHSLNKWRTRRDGSTKAVHIPTWDVEGVSKVFHTLASRLCEGGGASFVQIEGRDIELWAQGVLTLASLGCYGGSGAQGAEMRYVVIEIAMRRVTKLKADSAVRRALALALSIVIGGMDDGEVREILVGGASDVIVFPEYDEVADVGREAFEWLQRAAEGDADIGVRRFAAMTLRKWSQRVEAVLR